MPLPRRIACGLIGLYQHTLSPDHGPLRRFFPDGYCVFKETCSEYGKRVVAEHGVWKGGRMAWRRMWECRA